MKNKVKTKWTAEDQKLWDKLPVWWAEHAVKERNKQFTKELNKLKRAKTTPIRAFQRNCSDPRQAV